MVVAPPPDAWPGSPPEPAMVAEEASPVIEELRAKRLWRRRPKAAREPGARLVSLDAFRGLTIAGMLLVNNIALDTRTPVQLRHAPWNGGIRFADLIFPWFLLIVGVAIPFSAAAARRKNVPLWRYDFKVLGRVIALVGLGCLIDSSLAKQPLFDLNVLQLIGLSYGVASLLYALPLSRRLAVVLGFLVIHAAAIKYLPVPGLGRGAFGENANLIAHLNQTYLQPVHLDGVLSVIPASALVLIGTAIGDTLRWDARWFWKMAVLLATGAILLGAGWLWHFSLPFNKPVWTASYILYTAGMGCVILTALYALVDLTGWRWLPFPLVVFGSNAIVAYVGPILVKVYILRVWTWLMPDGKRMPLETALLHTAIVHYGPYRGGWVYTIGYMLVVWLVLLELYRRKLFLRV